jgi:hypothetical protein
MVVMFEANVKIRGLSVPDEGKGNDSFTSKH